MNTSFYHFEHPRSQNDTVLNLEFANHAATVAVVGARDVSAGTVCTSWSSSRVQKSDSTARDGTSNSTASLKRSSMGKSECTTLSYSSHRALVHALSNVRGAVRCAVQSPPKVSARDLFAGASFRSAGPVKWLMALHFYFFRVQCGFYIHILSTLHVLSIYPRKKYAAHLGIVENTGSNYIGPRVFPNSSRFSPVGTVDQL